jgi:hypothetical protein
MNAIGPIETAFPREPFDAARDAVTAWRGRCLDLFSRSEAAVTETLLLLAASKPRGEAIKLPHLVGQRYDELAAAIGPGGPFAEDGKAAAKALAGFRQHDDLRTNIGHGVFTVTLDRHGTWHLVIRLLALRSGRELRDVLVMEQREAAEILTRLERDASRLRSILREFCRQLMGA